MKNYLTIVFTVLLSLFSVNAMADFTPPAPTNYVVDTASKLDNDQLAKLNSKLDTLNKSSKNEIAVLVVPNMGGEDIEDVAQKTFRSWKIGKAGLDNGVLVVIAVEERKSRIQTGSGIGGELTDLQANDILRQNLKPHLKRGEFYQGLDETIDAVSSKLESRASTKIATKPQPMEPTLIILLVLLGLCGVIFFIWLISKISRGGGSSSSWSSGSSDWSSGGSSSSDSFGGFGGGDSGGGGSSDSW